MDNYADDEGLGWRREETAERRLARAQLAAIAAASTLYHEDEDEDGNELVEATDSVLEYPASEREKYIGLLMTIKLALSYIDNHCEEPWSAVDFLHKAELATRRVLGDW